MHSSNRLLSICNFFLTESSIPIDCSEEAAARANGVRHPSAHYVCAGGAGINCLDAASMLCDFKPDCPDATDEQDEICRKSSSIFDY